MLNAEVRRLREGQALPFVLHVTEPRRARQHIANDELQDGGGGTGTPFVVVVTLQGPAADDGGGGYSGQHRVRFLISDGYPQAGFQVITVFHLSDSRLRLRVLGTAKSAAINSGFRRPC